MDSKNKKSLLDMLSKKSKGDALEKLKAQCEHAQAKADSDRSMNVERFNKSYLYYTCRLPDKFSADPDSGLHKRFSDHIEPVLFNAVKDALPQLLESFTDEQSTVVCFRPRGYKKNPELEQIVNHNLNKVFLRDNDGLALLEGMIKTCLVHGDTIPKVFVDETTHRETASVEDWLDVRDLMAELNEGWTIELPKNFADKSGSYKGFEWKEISIKEQDPTTGETVSDDVLFIRGSVPLINIEKKVVVEETEPQDIYVNTDYGSDFSKCRYIAHRIKTTVGEAELRGFDPEELAKITDDSVDDNKLPEMFFSQTMYQNPSYGQKIDREVSIDPKERPISYVEHYIYSSFPTNGKETRLYQVIIGNGCDKPFSVTEVKRIPFVHGQCEPVQGQFFGRSFFDIAKSYQDRLTEANYKAAVITEKSTWPVYQAVKGQYNRETLLQNRPGAVMEIMAQGAVQRFEAQEISPSFWTNQKNIQASAENTLAQSVSLQTEAGTIPQIATATAYISINQELKKGKTLTNNIRRTLVEPLFTLIYEIIKDEKIPLEAPDGSMIEGSKLPDVYDLDVDPSTTYDKFAQDSQLTNTIGFIGQMTQINSSVVTPQNLYEIGKKLLEGLDLDEDKFLTDPSKAQQDPQAEHEAAEAAAINSELHKMQLQTAIVSMRKLAAETYKIEQEAEELVRDGHSNRLKDKADSMAKAMKIKSDALAHSESNQVKAQEVAVKDKAVNYETILAAQKHVTDITSPQINGVR